MSYHTHLPIYAKLYIGIPGVISLTNWLVKVVHNFADLTLVTSPQLKRELELIGVRRVAVWQKGINIEVLWYAISNSVEIFVLIAYIF